MTLQDKVRAKGYCLGASAYQLVNSPLDDAEWFLSSVAANGGTMSELFFIFTWRAGWKNCIYPIVKWEADKDEKTGQVLFDGYEFPIWDINRFDQVNVKKWVELFKLFPKYGLTLSLRIHDWCSIKDPFKKRHYPFGGRNIQHQQGLYRGGMWWYGTEDKDNPYGNPEAPRTISPYYKKLLVKLVDMLSSAGVCDDFRLVLMSEADYRADEGDSEARRDGKVILWHKFHARALRECGVKNSQMVISTSRALEKMARWEFMMEIHGINSPERLALMQKETEAFIKPENFFPNGDGPDPYAKGRRGDAPTKREPSNTQAKTIGFNLGESKIYSYFTRPADTLGVHKMRANSGTNYFSALKSMAQGVIR